MVDVTEGRQAMKPDWKDAPDWAQWLAMNEQGWWHWFEKRPQLKEVRGLIYRQWETTGKQELASRSFFDPHIEKRQEASDG